MKKNVYIVLGIVVVGLIISSLTTLLSAKRVIEASTSPDEKYVAYIAAQAGVEVARSHIEHNMVFGSGELPLTFHLDGMLFKVKWGDLSPESKSISVSSVGKIVISDRIVEEFNIDTLITPDYDNPSPIAAGLYFGDLLNTDRK